MMNKDEAGGNWKQFKGKMKEQWGKLTDDDMTVIEGKRDQLVGKNPGALRLPERSGGKKRLLTGKPVTTIAGNMFSPTRSTWMCFPLFACECGRAPLYCRPFFRSG
ncbi:stress-response protein [Salmonella enterica subsp. enterica]|uniref:Stress-response protein n=1 Tax=Salmonella enterica I TaxID=59201 RepID=A0A3S4LRM7_SALET|nr:stress-response protein [Salmonella enterica subsp. enterica]